MLPSVTVLDLERIVGYILTYIPRDVLLKNTSLAKT